ncbi:MAG: glycosyltransferase family 4 protein [Acetobacteraceae bacterium]|nr:glycosyltransferase family 4 protein [Acetobacteraceae bacterium]
MVARGSDTTCLMLLLNDIAYDGRVRNEARTLAMAGWRVVVVCNRQYSGPLPGLLPAGVEVRRLRLLMERPAGMGRGGPLGAPPFVRRLRVPGLKLLVDGVRLLDFACRVLLLTRRLQVQVVHAHDLRTLPLGALLARRLKARLVYDAHELFPDMTGRGRVMSRVCTWVEARLAPRADLVLTVGAHAAQELGRRYRLRRVAVIHNFPLSLPEEPGAGPDGQVSDQTAEHLRRPLLVHVGGMGAGRGLDVLVRALLLARSRPELLLVGGARRDFNRVAALYARLGGEPSRLQWVAPVAPEEVPSLVRSGSVGVVALENLSLNNRLALPNKLFHYLAAGLPVVASDLPAIAEFTKQHGVGELFKSGSAEDLGEAVDRLLLDPDRWAEARRAVSRVRSEVVWEKEAPRLVQLYHDLMTGQDGNRGGSSLPA